MSARYPQKMARIDRPVTVSRPCRRDDCTEESINAVVITRNIIDQERAIWFHILTYETPLATKLLHQTTSLAPAERFHALRHQPYRTSASSLEADMNPALSQYHPVPHLPSLFTSKTLKSWKTFLRV